MKTHDVCESKRKTATRRTVQTPSMIQIEPLECGSVALGIVLAHYGRWVSLEELRAACGVSRNGSQAANLLQAARSYGLVAQAFKAEPHQLSRLFPPLVLHWNFSHFVVFEGFTRKGRARINDPAMGRRTISAAELDESMTGVVLSFRPGPGFKRRGHRPSLFRTLCQRLQEASSGLAYVSFLSLALLVPGLLMPALSKLFIDHILVAHRLNWVYPLLGVMFLLLLMAVVLTWVKQNFLLRFETGMAIESTGGFMWHLLRLPADFFNHRFAGDISSRVALNDRLAKLLSGEVASNVFSILAVIFFAIVMSQHDFILTAVSILAAAMSLALLYWTSRRRAESNIRLLREEAQLNSTGLWGLEIIESLKATASEGDMFARWAGQQANVVTLRQQLEIANQPLEMLPTLVTALNAALILGLGGLRVIQGHLTIGGLVAFQILAAGFMAPINRLVFLGQRLQLAEGEVGLLDDVLRARPLMLPYSPEANEKDMTCLPRLSGRLDMTDVTFGYSPLDRPALRAINLSLQPGAWLAVVGKTGSGKSTLASLVSGLYEPWSGAVSYDGRLRSSIAREVWVKSVAVVSQDIFVFEGSVWDNITLWNPSISTDHVIGAARDACILSEIQARPNSFDELIAEEGLNWSAGQLQRFEIARALAGDPTLLVLDEATANLDARTEAQIVHNLRVRGCACLIIAHRLSTIRDADEIVVMDDGEIVERGTHYELMQAGGRYVDLVVNE